MTPLAVSAMFPWFNDTAMISGLVPLATEDVDIVQGYELGRGDPLHRRIIFRVHHHIVTLMFSRPGRDTDRNFRLFRRTLIESRPLTSSSEVNCSERMCSVGEQKARFVEAPVRHDSSQR